MILGAILLMLGMVSLNAQPALAADEEFVVRKVKDHGWLGVTMQNVDADMAEALQLKDEGGVLVNSVVEDSPAEKAGLEDGDVIIEFADKKIEDTGDLSRAVSATKPGDVVTVVIMRDGDRKKINVTIGEREMDEPHIWAWRHGDEGDDEDEDDNEDVYFFDGGPHAEGEIQRYFEVATDRGYMGVKLEGLTEQLGEYFGVEDGEGALVAEVSEDGPAAKAGLKAGDVIVKLGDEDIESAGDIHSYLRDTEEGDEINVTVVRDKRSRSFTVTLAEAPDEFAWFGRGGPRAFVHPDAENWARRLPHMELKKKDLPRRRYRLQRELEPSDELQEMRQELKKMQEELQEMRKEMRDR